MEVATNSVSSTGRFSPFGQSITIRKRDGRPELFDRTKIISVLQRIGSDLITEDIMVTMCESIQSMLFDGITSADIEKCCILAATSFIERDPAYDKIATRLLLQQLMREMSGISKITSREELYRTLFIEGIVRGVEAQLFDKRMLSYPLETLAQYLQPSRDELFTYMGLHSLAQRYLFKINGTSLEMPQAFWMRVAMGLALNESDPTARAQEFYDVISTMRYIPSTPTLFHSGFPVAQLSSCYLTTVDDDLTHIFKCLGDNAQLSKWAGGIGTDWTNIRGTGSFIKGIKATSQGVVPYLKIANDIVVAITRSGIRRGGKCAYLEAWHFDFEDFLDLRRNTGDERRRTHDMNTAAWVPDLFMKRMFNDESWTLFSPDEAPDLHHIYGVEFEQRYLFYEERARAGHIKLFREVSAKALWRKMLTRLFETGHPWITFKDPCNIRSPQDHVGVIHSSNLCTEITLNTSEEETAVCNLGSVNLGRHITTDGKLDLELLKRTVHTAIRMLDNVIDLNFYPTKEAKTSNLRHRPIGLGTMGFQDALFMMNIPFASLDAYEFADYSGEHIAYYAIEASMQLAQDRGAYETFPESKWDRGIFPLDTIDLLEKERGMPIEVSRKTRLDWDELKHKVKQHGMRNSNTMAVAPTATIATIAGCYPSIEPIFKNIYVKSNVSGEFTIVNRYLIEDLKQLRLWNQSMLDQLKYYDGDLDMISSIPDALKYKHKTAFELDPEWLIEITAVRGKWIDQSQSHNVFDKNTSGPKMSRIYERAWKCGLKTTYYYRTMGATQIEKSTLDAKEFGFTQKRTYDRKDTAATPQSCALDESCESCQ
jgi:ribonucleoside-diphosphate reductase alpha chain